MVAQRQGYDLSETGTGKPRHLFIVQNEPEQEAAKTVGTGKTEVITEQTMGGTRRSNPLNIAFEEDELTEEEAAELLSELEHPTVLPTLPPLEIPWREDAKKQSE